jgi:hypothetical protein
MQEYYDTYAKAVFRASVSLIHFITYVGWFFLDPRGGTNFAFLVATSLGFGGRTLLKA